MLTPKVPDRMGIGIVLGFCIPVLWVLLAAHNANSIDRTSSRSGLTEVERVDLSPVAKSGQGHGSLRDKEEQILAKLGWQKGAQSKSVAATQASELLEEAQLVEDENSGRAALRQQNLENAAQSQPIEAISDENAELLAALVAEYEELEQSAEALLHIEAGSDLEIEEQHPERTPSKTEVAEKDVQEELKSEGLQVVGEGKQWIENSSGSREHEQKVSYNPHFGRLELLQAG